MISADAVRLFVLGVLGRELADVGLTAADVDDDLDLIEARVIDSFGMLEVIAAVESHFAVEIDFEQLDPELMSSIGPFSRFVATESAHAA